MTPLRRRCRSKVQVRESAQLLKKGLVTVVGINTEWGLLMTSISEDTGGETPLQLFSEFRADYSCWCSSSPAGLILHQIEIGDEDEEFESSDSESNDDLELSKVTEMRLLPSYAGKYVRREVKILKALSNHNNLVKFYDVCEDALNVYVVTELCEGGELLERILSRGGRYSEEDAKAIVIQILSVIAFCHLQGVMHRDLKPEALLQNATESMKESKFTNLKYSRVEIDEVRFEWAECMLDYI
ncbi:hypothetical protein ZIOFF_056194 [Zingiber officinale]|uniref:Protein kinase domain-containing protein n=1 Tax=Zingiber officinale TaxID=94328 RepID=A0A8J5FDK8_ZINOF|nr:hypothetical protein ZIOFF_056194 [Zingiber officinale]